jgi:hypothetical protein
MSAAESAPAWRVLVTATTVAPAAMPAATPAGDCQPHDQHRWRTRRSAPYAPVLEPDTFPGTRTAMVMAGSPVANST